MRSYSKLLSLWSNTHLVYQEVRGGAGDAGEGVRGEGGVARCPGGGEGPAEFGARDSELSPDLQSSSPPTSHVHVLQHVLQHVHSHSVYLSLQQTVGQLRVVQKQLPGLLRVLLNAPLHLLHQFKHLLWGEAGHGLCDGLGGRFWGDRGPVQGGLCACVCVYINWRSIVSHTQLVCLPQ